MISAWFVPNGMLNMIHWLLLVINMSNCILVMIYKGKAELRLDSRPRSGASDLSIVRERFSEQIPSRREHFTP
jgi:hypothetical protein